MNDVVWLSKTQIKCMKIGFFLKKPLNIGKKSDPKIKIQNFWVLIINGNSEWSIQIKFKKIVINMKYIVKSRTFYIRDHPYIT